MKIKFPILLNQSKFLNLIFIAVVGNLLGCATGSAIITGNVRPAIEPTEVKIYLKPPMEYETIGLVEASSDVEFSAQAAQDRVIDKLKEKAAEIGANGVLINNTDTKTGIVGGYYYFSSYNTKTAQGQAIFVIQE
ncbi:MAG: hypothetical protein LBC64_04130 [Fibromonadaceae bacterium]|nr:hypothetical protein [Fibromonadaceae bacterium]